jgi:hypothetical protein
VFSASDTLKKDHGVFSDGSQLKGTYFWGFFNFNIYYSFLYMYIIVTLQ